MMWWGNGMGAFGWFVMIMSVLALWAIVVIAGMALMRGVRSNKSTSPSDSDPMRILDERLARGEIDIDEYRARREALRTTLH